VRRPADGRRRLEALAAIRSVAAFASIFTAGKRIRNILDKQAEPPAGDPDPALWAEEAERRLGAALADLGARVRDHVAARRYGDALALIEQFAQPVDAFFDGVLVMHQDPAVRANRLRLLRAVGEVFESYCDFSRFVLEETKSNNP
jgi:glycyl-tRNA synthetase beta chain